MSLTFDSYSTPLPGESFSNEKIANVTFAEADIMVTQNQLPHILPNDSIISWVFDTRVPTESTAITLAAQESIPCREDLLPITQGWYQAYAAGFRSVYIDLPNLGGPIWYHFSKACLHTLSLIRLIRDFNNHLPHLVSASKILQHIQASATLPSECIDDLRGNRVTEPLAGFHVTQTALHTLGCLLNEEWASEDILNAWSELMY
ncbi:hypothetical protein R3P38DRAFT_2550300, partial [Favolaschia claudopus]